VYQRKMIPELERSADLGARRFDPRERAGSIEQTLSLGSLPQS